MMIGLLFQLYYLFIGEREDFFLPILISTTTVHLMLMLCCFFGMMDRTKFWCAIISSV